MSKLRGQKLACEAILDGELIWVQQEVENCIVIWKCI